MSKKIILIILVILISGFLISKFTYFQPKTANTAVIKLNDSLYNFEIAETSSQKSTGLSNRKYLCQTCGMLFIFDKETILPFWMKDTLIPLDLIWMDSNGFIVDIQTAQPEPNTPIYKLNIYKNTKPAKYVIEINEGNVLKNNLKIGDQLNIIYD